MAVVVQQTYAEGDQYKTDDAEGTEVGYRVNANGVLYIVEKPTGKPPRILREYSPSGYVWVEGKRFPQELDKQDGVDGKIALSGGGGKAQFL